jgi:hypothetical protein
VWRIATAISKPNSCVFGIRASLRLERRTVRALLSKHLTTGEGEQDPCQHHACGSRAPWEAAGIAEYGMSSPGANRAYPAQYHLSF